MFCPQKGRDREENYDTEKKKTPERVKSLKIFLGNIASMWHANHLLLIILEIIILERVMPP